MLPTKDELIEKMAKAIIGSAEYASTPEKQYLMFKNEQPHWNDVAESALQALLSSLPEYHCDVCSVDMHMQLLGMKK